MKLRPKSVVQTELANQKKQQIDEGVNLAKKIDALRETLANEEKKLYEFRTQTVKIVTNEIAELIKKRDQLKDN